MGGFLRLLLRLRLRLRRPLPIPLPLSLLMLPLPATLHQPAIGHVRLQYSLCCHCCHCCNCSHCCHCSHCCRLPLKQQTCDWSRPLSLLLLLPLLPLLSLQPLLSLMPLLQLQPRMPPATKTKNLRLEPPAVTTVLARSDAQQPSAAHLRGAGGRSTNTLRIYY